MGGQPLGETMGVQHIARIGAGVNPDQMHTERINGYDPLPVIDAFLRKKKLLQEGRGPVLLDTITYRISGHSPSDASSYRSKEEIERWQQADSIRAFRAKLLENNAASEDALDFARTYIEAAIFDMFQLSTDLAASPRVSASRSSTAASPSSCSLWRRIPACSRFKGRFARPRTKENPSRR
jgi:2-oxoisovalerate dehydrogenase E1 component